MILNAAMTQKMTISFLNTRKMASCKQLRDTYRIAFATLCCTSRLRLDREIGALHEPPEDKPRVSDFRK